MTRETAQRVLGVVESATAAELATARRRLVATLHPDKHPAEQKEVFERLTADVLAAYDCLSRPSRCASGGDPGGAAGARVERELFDVRAMAAWRRTRDATGAGLAVFDRRFASDEIVAVAILGLDPLSHWVTGGETEHTGTALYLVAWNRTARQVESLDLDRAVLVDDLGHQYSSSGGFYWRDPTSRQFHVHGRAVAPNAKLDGFVLYPRLREGATCFTRWFLADTVYIMGAAHAGEYDVALPRGPQRAAARRVGLLPPGPHGGAADEGAGEGAALPRAQAVATTPANGVVERDAVENGRAKDALRGALVTLRRRIWRDLGTGPSDRGLLRKTMLDHLLRTRVTTEAEFYRAVPARDIARTDAAELAYLPDVLGVVRRAG